MPLSNNELIEFYATKNEADDAIKPQPGMTIPCNFELCAHLLQGG